jgi:hydrogenase maturation protease
MANESKPLVLGIGNVLMGDEGIGVHVVRAIEREGLIAGATVVDGGTGGFHLLGLLQAHDPIVFIDASMDGRPDGTITVLTPRFARDFPRSLSAHDIGLRDLLESASVLGPLPRMVLITVSVSLSQGLSLELSPPVAGAIDDVIRRVGEALSDSAVPFSL